jgi:hypothetical protein
MKILFLDFDGVLHPVGAGAEKFSCLPLLEGYLREGAAQDVRIVVTSTWRLAYRLDSLRGFFSPDIAPRIIGCVPELDEYDTDFERAEEIEAWLASHGQGAAWAALDDDPLHFPPRLRARTVITDGEAGLTAESIAALRALLN